MEQGPNGQTTWGWGKWGGVGSSTPTINRCSVAGRSSAGHDIVSIGSVNTQITCAVSFGAWERWKHRFKNCNPKEENSRNLISPAVSSELINVSEPRQESIDSVCARVRARVSVS